MDRNTNTSSGQTLGRRFSLSSLFSSASIQTNLPEYSEGLSHDDVDEHEDADVAEINQPPEFNATTNFLLHHPSPSSTIDSTTGTPVSLTPSRRSFNILGKQINFSFTFLPPSDVERSAFGQLSTIRKALRGGGSTVAGTSLPLRGHLVLELLKAQVIQSLSLNIVGVMFYGVGGERWKFLNQVVHLWNKGDAAPLPMQVESDDVVAEGRSFHMPANGKLSVGVYKIPFTQPFPVDDEAGTEDASPASTGPRDITPFVLDKKPTNTKNISTPDATRYPPSWQEKGTDVTISYKMVAQISFGRLHTSKSMELPFVYLNAFQAVPMSKSRREAYGKKTRCVGSHYRLFTLPGRWGKVTFP